MIRIKLTRNEQNYYVFVDKILCFYDVLPYKRDDEPQKEAYAVIEYVSGQMSVDQNANQIQSRIDEALKK